LLVAIIWLFRFSAFRRARVILWRWRQHLRGFSQQHQGAEEDPEVGVPPDPSFGKRRDWIAFVYYQSYYSVGPLPVTATKKLGALVLLAFRSANECSSPEPTELSVTILALLIPSFFAAYCLMFERLLLLNAVGLPLVIAGFAQETETLFVEQRSVEEWAVHWGYSAFNHIDYDYPLHLGATHIRLTTAPLPTVAVAIHKISLFLQLLLLVMALFKLLWIPDAVKSYLLSRGFMTPGRKDDIVVENVFRLTRRFD
jgi:hypothetical protein